MTKGDDDIKTIRYIPPQSTHPQLCGIHPQVIQRSFDFKPGDYVLINVPSLRFLRKSKSASIIAQIKVSSLTLSKCIPLVQQN